jgi:hypothetical protein
MTERTREEKVAAFRERARVLYEGRQVAHRSCGIALAETFGRPSAAYQSLRKGGLTGEGECGAVLGGLLVLGELLGDPDPAGPATPRLKEAAARFRAEIARRLPRGEASSIVCNELVRPFPVFQSEERALFCTGLAAAVAEIVAEILVDLGAEPGLGGLPAR